MKAVLLVCLLAGTALAAPTSRRPTKLDVTLSDHVRAAEQAWTAAETETDPAKQTAAWESAAAAFALIDGDPIDAPTKRAAASAGWLAWKNALGAPRPVASSDMRFDRGTPRPRPVPAREQQLIAAIDRYARYVTDVSDPELPVALVTKARTLASVDQLDTAIPIYRDVMKRFPRHPVVEGAALLVLDAYNRLGQYDTLVTLASELAKDTAFLDGRDDLARTVKQIQRAGTRKRAEELERRAKTSKQLEDYVAAGQAYLDIYNADPELVEGDEILYNAGVAFEEGAAMSNAIQMFLLLEKHYPNSKITARATARLGKLYGDIAMYDRAAEKLEQYAKKYAGEKDAYDAMSDAVYYRKALGDRAKAIEDTKYFVKTFGLRKPREAANAWFSLTPLYESEPTQLLAHLREYVRVYGSKGGSGLLVIAHAKLGLALWKQSCPTGGFAGLCVKATENAPRTCGKGTTRVLTVIPRDERKVKEAVVALTAAMKEHERRGDADDPSARYYYAQAKLAVADLELERFIALAAPTNLDFSPATTEAHQASMKRLTTWLDEKKKAGGTATRKYEDVLAAKDAASSIDAVERLALVTQSFATALVATKPPASVKGADKHAAYCQTMTSFAEPLEAATVTSFGLCLIKSTELSWFGDASARCERELYRLQPDDYPRMTELRARATYVAPVIASEPPVH